MRKDLNPLIRLTANPGGRGHTWLKRGFVDPAPPGTVFVDPDTQKSRVYVPASVYDNPHVSASTIRDLEGLPEPLRSAWLLGRWDVFVGQFFPEWDQRIHSCEPFAIPKDWRRFGMLDYGYAQSPLVYLQAAISPDRQIYLYREIVRLQMVDERQAAEITHACADDPPEDVVAGDLLSGLLVCGTCSGHYVVRVKKRDWQYYGCASRRERGTTICANDRLVRREVIEAKVLDHVFGDLFAPHRLAYLSHAVDAAIARALEDPETGLRRKEAALAAARAELAHIADAIRQGILTPTTRAMLEAAEQRITRLEADVQEARRRPRTVTSLASSVERYLEDLRATVGRNTDQARRLLARGLDQDHPAPRGLEARGRSPREPCGFAQAGRY